MVGRSPDQYTIYPVLVLRDQWDPGDFTLLAE